MAQDDLTAGDSTPKLARASIKDIALAVNRISYTFKTPDSLVAPDALQLNEDGNLSLGTSPIAMAGVGRNFTVYNADINGGSISHTNLTVQSASGLAFINVKTGNRANGVRYWDGSSTTTPMVQSAWFPQEFVWRLQIYSGTAQSTALKVSNTGQIGISENVSFQTLLNVGTIGAAGTNELWVASNTTTFEGAFLGAYDNRSGAKLDLNTQANTTNVSSWRLSHDLNDGGQGRLSFRFAPAATSRGALVYTEKAGISANGSASFGSVARSVAGAVRFVHIENSGGQGSIGIVRNSNDSSGAVLAFGKTRGTAAGANNLLQDQDTIGAIQFGVGTGTSLDGNSAQIFAIASGTHTATSLPGQLAFGTTPVNAVAPVVAMRISNQQNVSIGTASDVARLVLSGGTTYPTGENVLYLQSSSPSTIPALITGSSSGTTSISGGSPLASGGARGGQIDLVGGGALTYPGHAFIRTGTNADGQPGSTVFTFTPGGLFGVNTQTPAHRIFARGNTGERIRVMMDAYGEYSGFTGRRANGTSAAPTKVLANDALVFINTHAYTGTQYVAGGQITIQADADWSDTATPSSILFAPGHPTALGQNTRAIFTSAGKFGFNALSPVAVMTVTHPDATSGVGYEIDPNPTNGAVQIRSYDRSATQFRDYAVAARSIQLGVGTSAAVVTAAITTAGNFVVGQTPALYVSGSGTGNATIDGQFIIAANSYSSTALCISSGEKYSGMKIKVGPNTTPNGSADYYDITTRPGLSGVASNADYVMIRMESAVSKSNPDMYLQTSGAGGRVVIGGATPVSAARLNVIAASGGGSIAQFSGLSSSQVAADVVISRSGASLNTTAGMNSSIQLSNGTNGTHILFQEYNSGFQLFNVIGGNWYERMFMDQGGSFSFGAHNTAAGPTAETVQVVGRTAGGNDYCYFAQGQTATGNAVAMRYYSVTTGATVGSITFNGSTTSYNTTSDSRMKENIVDAPTARDMIDAIQVRSFNFKKTQDFTKFGFIAQELYEIAPWAVSKGSADSCPDFNGMNGIWGVDHSKLVPSLVKAHQEVSKELKDTKVKLEQAESDIADMKRKMDAILHRLWQLENPQPKE